MARDADDGGSKREIVKTMAVAVPETFLSSVRQFRPREDAEHKTWRLPRDHIADLRDVARGVEETNAGVCCRYLIDQFSGAGHSDIDEDGYVHHLDAVERFCDTYGVWKHPTVESWRHRIGRCRRAIARMHGMGHHKHVGVLHVVYGYPDPLTKEFPKKSVDSLGEMASLIKYTDLVEVKRQEMARQEAMTMSKRVARIEPTKDLPGHWKADGDTIYEWDKRFQNGDEITRTAIRQNLPVEYGPLLIDLMKHRELYEYSLRCISSSDVVRQQFAPLEERDETDDQYRERRANYENRRDVFVSQVKVESDKLLVAASRSYHAAWLASGG